MIGVNKYVSDDVVEIPLLEIDDSVEVHQVARLQEVKRKRDNRHVGNCLKDLAQACKKGENVMPFCIETVKAYGTLQEICDVYREVYGEYRDPGIY